MKGQRQPAAATASSCVTVAHRRVRRSDDGRAREVRALARPAPKSSYGSCCSAVRRASASRDASSRRRGRTGSGGCRRWPRASPAGRRRAERRDHATLPAPSGPQCPAAWDFSPGACCAAAAPHRRASSCSLSVLPPLLLVLRLCPRTASVSESGCRERPSHVCTWSACAGTRGCSGPEAAESPTVVGRLRGVITGRLSAAGWAPRGAKRAAEPTVKCASQQIVSARNMTCRDIGHDGLRITHRVRINNERKYAGRDPLLELTCQTGPLGL